MPVKKKDTKKILSKDELLDMVREYREILKKIALFKKKLQQVETHVQRGEDETETRKILERLVHLKD